MASHESLHTDRFWDLGVGIVQPASAKPRWYERFWSTDKPAVACWLRLDAATNNQHVEHDKQDAFPAYLSAAARDEDGSSTLADLECRGTLPLLRLS